MTEIPDIEAAEDPVEVPPRPYDPDRSWGMGPMPPGLERFNWAALLMPFVWLVFAGVWDWLVIWMAVRGAAFVYEMLVVLPATDAQKLVPWMELVRIVLYIPVDVLLVVLGVKANRLSWEAEARAIAKAQAGGFDRRRRTVRERLRNDRVLAYVGAGLTITLVGMSVYEFATGGVDNVPLALVGVAVDGAMFGAAFVLWLRSRRRF